MKKFETSYLLKLFLHVAACVLRIKYHQDKNSGNLMFQKMSCLHENKVCNVFVLFQLLDFIN